MKIKCYYSPEFTYTLLSDNNVLELLPMKKSYCGQSMVKFFEPHKIKELPMRERDKIKNQKLDEVTRNYNHNFGNCILFCTHKRKFNRNVYIPWVIRNGLCNTMPLILRSDIPADVEGATIYNSREKAYKDDLSFRKACDAKVAELIYKHQEQEHFKLMRVLETVPKQYHSILFEKWIKHNTPVYALTEKAREMFWHQRLTHMGPQSIQNAHKYVDAVPDLLKFSFDDIDQRPNCIDAKLQKNAPGKRSLSESVSQPYQGLFCDLAYPGKISYDKEGNVIESSREDVEGLNGELAWILVTDAKTKMIHYDPTQRN